MYMITQAERVVRIPPVDLDDNLGESVIDRLTWNEYEGKVCPDLSVALYIFNVKTKGQARIVYGDEHVYQTVTYDQLVFKANVGEMFDGFVVSVCSMGAFVRIGPVDALVHMSQIADDFFDVDVENQRLVGKNTGKTLSKGDLVRTRMTQIKKLDQENYKNSEFGLTMRQPGLGKLEWIEEDHAKSMKKDKGES